VGEVVGIDVAWVREQVQGQPNVDGAQVQAVHNLLLASPPPLPPNHLAVFAVSLYLYPWLILGSLSNSIQYVYFVSYQ